MNFSCRFQHLPLCLPAIRMDHLCHFYDLHVLPLVDSLFSFFWSSTFRISYRPTFYFCMNVHVHGICMWAIIPAWGGVPKFFFFTKPHLSPPPHPPKNSPPRFFFPRPPRQICFSVFFFFFPFFFFPPYLAGGKNKTPPKETFSFIGLPSNIFVFFVGPFFQISNFTSRIRNFFFPCV